MKSAFILLLSVICILEIGYNYFVVPHKINRIMNGVLCVVLFVASFFLLYNYYLAKSHPSIDRSVIIDFPFKGKWIASGAGATGLTNHHDRITSQKYAVDISRIGSNDKLFIGADITKEGSHTYGAEIFSPVDGKVVYLIDSLPDTPTTDRDNLADNHVIIQFQDSLYLALAHLQHKTIPVKKGANVTKGTYLGKVGLSGNTDFCHLHIHIQDRAKYDLENGKTFPIRFREFRRKRFLFWRNRENDFLLRNDIIEL